MIDKYDIPYEWYNNLCTTGTLPTKEDIMRTVGNRCGCLDINAFRCKDLYNSKFGFALLSQETVNDMAKFFDDLFSGLFSRKYDPTLQANLSYSTNGVSLYWNNSNEKHI